MIYTEGFRRAQELGVQVQQQTEVQGAILHGWPHPSLITSQGTIEADWFVNATNAWAARVSPRIGGMPLPIVSPQALPYFLKPAQPVMAGKHGATSP